MSHGENDIVETHEIGGTGQIRLSQNEKVGMETRWVV